MQRKAKSILIVDDESEIVELLACMVEDFCPNIPLVRAHSGNEAFQKFKDSPNVGLIITDYSMPDGDGKFLFENIQPLSINLPFVFCTSVDVERVAGIKVSPPIYLVEKPNIHEKLLKILSDVFPTQFEDYESNKGKGFKKIPLGLLKFIGLLPFDLYLEMTDQKKIKIFSANTLFEQGEVENFKRKGQSHLFIKAEDVDLFYAAMTASLTINKNIDSDVAHSLGFEIINFANKFGISKPVQQMAETTVNFVLNECSRDRHFSETFSRLKLDKEFFEYHHVFLSYVAIWFADQIGFGNEMQCRKLAFASLFHDLSLVDEEKLKGIETAQDLEKGKFGFRLGQSWYQHPIKTRDILMKLTWVPSDVATIVVQHHEEFNGEGFPYHLTADKLHQLSLIFILAHQMINYFHSNFNHTNIDFFNFALSKAKGTKAEKMVGELKSKICI